MLPATRQFALIATAKRGNLYFLLPHLSSNFIAFSGAAMPHTHTTIEVDLPSGSRYPIYIGADTTPLLPGAISAISPSARPVIVTDATVARLHLSTVEAVLSGAEMNYDTFILPAGERSKTAANYLKIIRYLAAAADARDTVVIALGGGVVGDMAGFAAATYRRGVPVIQLPTTLLAAVDSSVGGKTAVDLPEGKNLLGCFHQPSAVLISTDFLATLPPREFRAGMSEVIKYGFILDADFADFLHKSLSANGPAMTPADVIAAIRRSCELKALVVAQDERETTGRRAILNFGHTFAHALEAACGYGRYRHGEAVAIGMVCAADLSRRLGMLSSADAALVTSIVSLAGLPTTITGATPETLITFMYRDKKTSSGVLRFAVLEKIGAASLTSAATPEMIAHIITDNTAS